MLSVQSLQAFSATAIARGPGGVQRLAGPTAPNPSSSADAAPVRPRGASPATSPATKQGPPPTNLPRGALLDRVV